MLIYKDRYYELHDNGGFYEFLNKSLDYPYESKLSFAKSNKIAPKYLGKIISLMVHQKLDAESIKTIITDTYYLGYILYNVWHLNNAMSLKIRKLFIGKIFNYLNRPRRRQIGDTIKYLNYHRGTTHERLYLKYVGFRGKTCK